MSVVFPDVSVWQRNFNPAAIRRDTAALSVQVSYGVQYDPYMPGMVGKVRACAYTASIWYLFLRATQSIQAQTQVIVDVLPELQHGEGVCVDWETDGSLPTVQQRDEALHRLDDHYQQLTTLYGPASLIARNRPTDGRPLWVASYGGGTPAQPWDIFQFSNGVLSSSGMAIPTWQSIGKCDTNFFPGTPEELAQRIHPGNNVIKVQTEDDEMANDCARTIRWADGVLVIQEDGGTQHYDVPMHGNMIILPDAEKQGFQRAAGGRAVDPNDKSAGYIIYGQNGAPYKYDRAKAVELGLPVAP